MGKLNMSLQYSFILFISVFCGTTPLAAQTDTLRLDSLPEMIVSASRISEKLLASPVSVAKLDADVARTSPAPFLYDALGYVRGVHTITPSLGFKVINTRGFANTTNVRFVQLVDGVDNQSPHIGAPMADALMPGDLDMVSAEVVAGVATALYGMNATNGLVNFQTKNPFETEGLSFRQQAALYHFGSPEGISPKAFAESSLRWAKVLSAKWAFKINTTFTKGYDWLADNRDDLYPGGNASAGLTGADNPAYDAVNGYGNESSNRRTLSLGGKNYVVARSGYLEREVADYGLQNIKAETAVFWRPAEGTELSYTLRGALLNTIYQRSNRFRLERYRLSQQVVQFKNPVVQARAYLTGENTGDSYNLRSMAENIDRRFKPDNAWFADYAAVFETAAGNGFSIADAHRVARLAADENRPRPNTATFENLIETLRHVNNWDVGAALQVKARLAHAEGVINAGKLLKMKKLDWQIGADTRDYIIVPDGNYFINPTESGADLNYWKYGFFTQVAQSLMHDKLRISATLRADKCQYFDLVWNPRLTAVYDLGRERYARFSFQNGYRFPSIFEGFSNINSGGVKRVGGLRVMSNGVFENIWLKSSIDTFQAAVNKDVNTAGLSQADAIEKNKVILQRSTYTYLQPEFMRSYEMGFRGMFFQNRLFVDVDAYYNFYENFMAQVEGSVPNTGDAAQIPTALFHRNQQTRYRLWTNSKTTAYNYGTSIEMRLKPAEKFTVAANFAYTALRHTARNDGLEDGFNTPKYSGNLSLTARGLGRHWGFGIAGRWQSGFLWQSFLVNGQVPPLGNVDAFVSCTMQKMEVKIGGTNLLNGYYYSMLGGSNIGGFYYSTITYHF